jgi:hypothetical protein
MLEIRFFDNVRARSVFLFSSNFPSIFKYSCVVVIVVTVEVVVVVAVVVVACRYYLFGHLVILRVIP